jgi:hypothetical protein
MLRMLVIVVQSQFVASHRRQLKFRGALKIHALAANTAYRLAYQLVASVKLLASLDGIRVC